MADIGQIQDLLVLVAVNSPPTNGSTPRDRIKQHVSATDQLKNSGLDHSIRSRAAMDSNGKATEQDPPRLCQPTY